MNIYTISIANTEIATVYPSPGLAEQKKTRPDGLKPRLSETSCTHACMHARTQILTQLHSHTCIHTNMQNNMDQTRKQGRETGHSQGLMHGTRKIINTAIKQRPETEFLQHAQASRQTHRSLMGFLVPRIGHRGGAEPASSATGTVHTLKFLKLEGKAVQVWMKEILAEFVYVCTTGQSATDKLHKPDAQQLHSLRSNTNTPMILNNNHVL